VIKFEAGKELFYFNPNRIDYIGTRMFMIDSYGTVIGVKNGDEICIYSNRSKCKVDEMTNHTVRTLFESKPYLSSPTIKDLILYLNQFDQDMRVFKDEFGRINDHIEIIYDKDRDSYII